MGLAGAGGHTSGPIIHKTPAQAPVMSAPPTGLKWALVPDFSQSSQLLHAHNSQVATFAPFAAMRAYDASPKAYTLASPRASRRPRSSSAPRLNPAAATTAASGVLGISSAQAPTTHQAVTSLMLPRGASGMMGDRVLYY